MNRKTGQPVSILQAYCRAKGLLDSGKKLDLVLRVLRLEGVSLEPVGDLGLSTPVPLTSANSRMLPVLTYEAIYDGVALPSVASKGHSMVARGEKYLFSVVGPNGNQLPPRLRDVKICSVEGRHLLVTSRTVASMRSRTYETRLFWYRNGPSCAEPWVLLAVCECKNGLCGRCAHVVATVLLVSKLQHPEDHRIPWKHAPHTRSIYHSVRWLTKRKALNAPVSDHTGFDHVPRKRRSITCRTCGTQGHRSNSCPTRSTSASERP